MTEQEAREKRCCGPEGCGIEKDVVEGLSNLAASEGIKVRLTERFCIVSDCMAWRWKSGLRCTQTITQGNKVIREYEKEFEPETDGFCGLAGK